MKKNYYQIIFAILFLMGLQFNSALANEKIKLRLHQPPPNQLGVKDLWKLDITNTTRENINIYLTGTATETKKGLIVSGKSLVFSVSPGKKTYTYDDFKSGEVNWKDKSIQEVLLRTGNVPEGEYTICVTAFYENNEIADQESCIEQSIKLEGSISLISPSDGEEIDPNQPLTFTWTPLPGAKEYTLKLVEVKGDESPEAAMKRDGGGMPNRISMNAKYQLLPSEIKKLEIGKKYAWMVSSGSVESEVGTFKMKDPAEAVMENKRIIIKWGRGYPAGSGNCHCCGICEIIIKSLTPIDKPDDNTGIGTIYAIDSKTLEIKIDKKTGLTPAAYDTNFSTGYFVFDEDYVFGNDIKEMLQMKEVVTVKAGRYKVTEKDGMLTMRFPSEESNQQQIEPANQNFRTIVASALQEAALLSNISVRTDNFAAILSDDGGSLVVNAGITGAENLTLEQMAQGADVLFTFVRLPQGSALSSGFYTIRISQKTGTTKWLAQFKNHEGRVVLETDAEVSPGDRSLDSPSLTLTIWRRLIFFDAHGTNSEIKISGAIGTGGLDPTPLTPSGQKIVQAQNDFQQTALTEFNTGKTSTLQKVIIETRDDILIAYTVFQGAEKLTQEQLAKGQDVITGYFRFDDSSDFPPGYYTVRFLSSGGKWLARYLDSKGNTVKEIAADVGAGTGEQDVHFTASIDVFCITVTVCAFGYCVSYTHCYPEGKRLK